MRLVIFYTMLVTEGCNEERALSCRLLIKHSWSNKSALPAEPNFRPNQGLCSMRGKNMIWHDPGSVHLHWLADHFTFCYKQFRNLVSSEVTSGKKSVCVCFSFVVIVE